MKKTVAIAALGLAVSAISSFGQGSIAFDTYNAQSFAGIITTYGAGSGGLTGTGIGSTFTGVLLWSATPITESATTGPVTEGTLLNAGWTIGSTALFNTGAATGAGGLGYITGPNLNISAAVGQNLYFEIAAYTGASYATAGGFAGHSASFQATLATGTTLPNANQLNAMAPFSVYTVTPVPEPATLALAGMGGLAALLAFRRKQV